MKYQCDMIRDLMPLCADGAASDASRQAVREHIETCTECARCWDEFRQGLDLAAEAPAPQEKGYAKAAKRYRKKWLLRMLAVFFCGFLVTWSVYQIYIGSPYYHGRSTADGAIREALSGGNGKRLLSRTVAYDLINQYDTPDGSGSIYFVRYQTYSTNAMDLITAVNVTQNQNGLYVGKVNQDQSIFTGDRWDKKMFLQNINGTTAFGVTSLTGLPVTQLRLTVSGKEQLIQADSENNIISFFCDVPMNTHDITGEALDKDGNVLLRLKTAAELGYEITDALWIWDHVS